MESDAPVPLGMDSYHWTIRKSLNGAVSALFIDKCWTAKKHVMENEKKEKKKNISDISFVWRVYIVI